MPRQQSGILGIDKLMSNLRHELKKIEGRSAQGIIQSMILIRQDMENTEPLIPIDTGNLRGSWFSQLIKQSNGEPVGMMGFTANYAIFVHEMTDENTGKKINWKRPRSGAKFFEKALYRNKEKILQIMRDNAKIR